ncbi:embryonic protein UVS.2-like isoform X2 [Ascaphus truei]|uniref:embryonic protein UVS.2-like isoform X2 n=1 Tax=Ascaphus truei TaxID=8439 RepID=UPI003F5A94FD
MGEGAAGRKWSLKNRRFVRNVQGHTAQKSVFERIYELNRKNDSRDSFKPVDTNNMKLTSYDYGSIMHYGKAAFSINGFLPTMIAVPNNNTAFGQDFSMSDMDLKKINLLYQCDRYLNVMKNTLAPAVSSTTRKTTGQSTTKRTIATTTTTAKPAAAISSGCGGNLTAPSGVITSPNYPDNYPSKSYCHWNITTSSRITITFTDFDVESISGCLWDYVRVISEPFRNDSSLIPNYCGTLLPPSFTSYGRSMQVVFVSDRSVERRGFRLVYNTK